MLQLSFKSLLMLTAAFFSFSNSALAIPSAVIYGVTKYQTGKAFDGYTLYTPLGGATGSNLENTVYLINMSGQIVHTWQTANGPGLYGHLLPDGTLLYAAKTAAGEGLPKGGGGTIQEIDWDGNVIWEYQNEFLHHDVDKLPNSNILALLWEPMSVANQAAVRGGAEGTELDGLMYADAIVELDYQTKEVVWEWHVQDQLRPFSDYPLLELLSRAEWTHANSIDYLPAGNSFNGRESILMSLRQLDLIIIIDKETSEIVWQWGPGEISKQHDATLLDNGHILVFDNGVFRSPTNSSGNESTPHSRVVEVDPQSGEVVWYYEGAAVLAHDFFSSVISGAQRLPNGNTLITEGLTGRIFEVSTTWEEDAETAEAIYKNEIVWEYVSPHISPYAIGNAIFRAYRYGPAAINWPKQLAPTDTTLSQTLVAAQNPAQAAGLIIEYRGWIELFAFLFLTCFGGLIIVGFIYFNRPKAKKISGKK